jgi:hypothetical protein
MADSKERRKTARQAAPATPKPDSRSASMPASGGGMRTDATSQETRRQIAEAAYFRAKERGFAPGRELDDWVEAESEVMGRVNGSER